MAFIWSTGKPHAGYEKDFDLRADSPPLMRSTHEQNDSHAVLTVKFRWLPMHTSNWHPSLLLEAQCNRAYFEHPLLKYNSKIAVHAA